MRSGRRRGAASARRALRNSCRARRATRGRSVPSNRARPVPKSAEFLAELRSQFANLGLAAAAYNAGPRRVQEWLAGIGGMPAETRNYVATITGVTVDDWVTGT